MLNALLAATVDRFPLAALVVVAVLVVFVGLAIVADVIVGAAEDDDAGVDARRRAGARAIDATLLDRGRS